MSAIPITLFYWLPHFIYQDKPRRMNPMVIIYFIQQTQTKIENKNLRKYFIKLILDRCITCTLHYLPSYPKWYVGTNSPDYCNRFPLSIPWFVTRHVVEHEKDRNKCWSNPRCQIANPECRSLQLQRHHTEIQLEWSLALRLMKVQHLIQQLTRLVPSSPIKLTTFIHSLFVHDEGNQRWTDSFLNGDEGYSFCKNQSSLIILILKPGKII